MYRTLIHLNPGRYSGLKIDRVPHGGLYSSSEQICNKDD